MVVTFSSTFLLSPPSSPFSSCFPFSSSSMSSQDDFFSFSISFFSFASWLFTSAGEIGVSREFPVGEDEAEIQIETHTHKKKIK
jgi:hypothetical protein